MERHSTLLVIRESQIKPQYATKHPLEQLKSKSDKN